MKVDKRFSKGFQVSGAYALSRYWTLVTISSLDNFHDGHGISAGNPRHRFTGSGIWDLPKYKGGQKLMQAILNDWQLSTVIDMRSGTPTSVVLPGTLDIEGDGTFTFRLPGTTVSSFGHNIGADGIRNFVAQYNGIVAAQKDTPLDAYIRPTATRNATTVVITITAPGRNPVFNFGQPTGRVSPIFGTGSPRAFQLAARISF